jgi:hypothetical protein
MLAKQCLIYSNSNIIKQRSKFPKQKRSLQLTNLGEVSWLSRAAPRAKSGFLCLEGCLVRRFSWVPWSMGKLSAVGLIGGAKRGLKLRSEARRESAVAVWWSISLWGFELDDHAALYLSLSVLRKGWPEEICNFKIYNFIKILGEVKPDVSV